MRIVFLGTPRPAVESLEALVAEGHEITHVVTRPDRRGRRSSEAVPPPVRRAADRLGIEALQPTRIKDPVLLDLLRAARPEALVVVAYGRILPASWLELAPQGAINLHFSLLPAYRGAAPVQWALIRGESETGVTTMRINERMDEGDVLLQETVRVLPGEHAPGLTERLASAGAALLVRTLERLARGELDGRPQDARSASHAPILRGDEGRVDPRRATAVEIEGRIRGLDPWPGVWLRSGRRRLRLVEGRSVDGPTSREPPGTLVRDDEGGVCLVCCGGSLLRLARVQLDGRRALDVGDALNGRQIAVGARLESLGNP